MLALTGSKDVQVPAEVNLKAIAKALKAGGNKRFKTVNIPDLNHAFQKAGTGLVEEYGVLEETFHEPTLEMIIVWMLGQVKG